ncbi:MAG TPA: Crp/Fnr family transcriptional regulator [Pseudobdellovibrionaceae bacterium]|nr:Crp/Fnr family transcriptional regulator [Pseudobdellovibrionaceae bacterium]
MAGVQNLKDIFLFKELSDQEMAVIDKISIEKDFSPGQDIFISGQKASAFYLIRMGSIKIFTTSNKGDNLSIATLGSGSHFGEIPFLDSGVRSANAQTIEPSKIIEVPYSELSKTLEANPNIGAKVFRAFSKYLAARLRNTLDDLGHAKEVKLKHF